MQTIDLVFSEEVIDELFPYENEDGQNVIATIAAQARAAAALDVTYAEIKWHLPDVFAVRYGSNFIASAQAGNKKVRFLSTTGTFQDGDDL